MPTSKGNCCIVCCHNSYINTEGKNVVFYRFLGRPWEKEHREMWISSVKRINEHGTPWQPSKNSRISSDHFITKNKTDQPLHSDYVPSIFPDCYKKRKADDTRRFSRLQQRKRLDNYKNIEAGENLPAIEDVGPRIVDEHFKDKCTQASHVYKCDTFVFSLERFENSVTAQANIYFNTGASRIPKPNKDAETFTDEGELINGFYGFKSITDEKQLTSISGVSYAISHTILNLLTATKKKLSKENRLLLMKVKLGLSYAALGVLFQIHSTTASSVFKQ